MYILAEHWIKLEKSKKKLKLLKIVNRVKWHKKAKC